MLAYLIKRIIYMIPVTLVLSFICFLVVDLAPGDFVTVYMTRLQALSSEMTQEAVAAQMEFLDKMRELYGLDKPMLVRYWVWLEGIVTRGDFGYAFMNLRPVSTIIWEKMAWTLALTSLSMVFSLVVGFVVGVYAATHQYGIVDYIASIFSYIGLATPNFFLALLLMTMVVFVFKGQVGGLFSAEYVGAQWTWGKFWDLMNHLWIPVVIIGTAGAAANIRIVRGNLLDLLGQPYIQTARAKGQAERVVIYRHALRNSLHPLIMRIGSSLPALISGEIIISIVLGLPTVGNTFYSALLMQDSYLAGSFLVMSALVLQVGNLLADIALVRIDPTISFE